MHNIVVMSEMSGVPHSGGAPRRRTRVGLAGMFGLDFLRSGRRETAGPSTSSGIEVRATAGGQLYCVGSDGQHVDEYGVSEADEAENEWVRRRVALCISGRNLEREYGLGIWLYMDFAVFLIIVNCILVGFALICWLPFIISPKEDHGWGLENFFVSQFSSDMRIVWTISCVLTIIFSFVFGPLYVFRISRVFEKRQRDDAEDFFEGSDADVIRGNRHVSWNSKFWRTVLSYLVFAVILFVQGIVTYFLTTQMGEAGNEDSIVGALVVSTINLMWRKVCTFLTRFEKHLKWSSLRKHNTGKFVIFRLLNISVLYAVKYGAGESSGVCFLSVMGRQFFWLMVVDVTLLNLLELVGAPLYKYFCINKEKFKGSDEDMRPEFDTSEEYLELVYRQFIVHISFPVMPMLTVLAVASSVFEVFLDRLRLTRICRRPPRTSASMRKFLAFFLLLSSAFSLLTFPAGSIFILTNAIGEDDCPIYN